MSASLGGSFAAGSEGGSFAPSMRGPQVVRREDIEAGISSVPHPLLRQAMVQAFNEMLQGSSPGFQLLRGAALPACAPSAPCDVQLVAAAPR